MSKKIAPPTAMNLNSTSPGIGPIKFIQKLIIGLPSPLLDMPWRVRKTSINVTVVNNPIAFSNRILLSFDLYVI